MVIKLIYRVFLILLLSSNYILHAEENVINVYGLIIQKPCEIVPNDTTNVDFGNLSFDNILENNSSLKSFEVHLDSCPRLINTKFIGANINNQILTIDSASTASGIGIQLYNEENIPIELNRDYSFRNDTNDSLHILKFNAKVVPLDNVRRPEDLQPGTFSAVVTYEISYD